jgi:hypothetical protein
MNHSLYKKTDGTILCHLQLTWWEWHIWSGTNHIKPHNPSSYEEILELIKQASTNKHLQHHVYEYISNTPTTKMAWLLTKVCEKEWIQPPSKKN